MDWLPLIPPIFAICLLSFGRFTKNYIRKRIKEFCDGRSDLKGKHQIIEHIAVSWEATSAYFGNLVTLLVALVAIKLRAGDNWLFVVNFLFFVIVLYLSMWTMFSLQPDELESRLTHCKFPFGGINNRLSYATVCTFILMAGNVLILGITAWSEYSKHRTVVITMNNEIKKEATPTR